MNISTVNELIHSLESAGELSIKETKVMALAKAYQQLVRHLDEFISPVNDCIWIHDDPRNAWIVTGDVTHPSGEYGWSSLSPANLIPIDGDDFSNEDEHQKEREHA